MKRSLSRGEWLLIGGPLVGFGIFAALWARWKATAPATLAPASVPLFSAHPVYNGRFVVGLGGQIDATNQRASGTPWQFLRWNARTGRLETTLSENRPFYNWTFSRDGELLALYQPGRLNRKSRKQGVGTVIVRRVIGGDDLATWPVKPGNTYSRAIAFSPDGNQLIMLGDRLERFDVATGKLLGAIDASKVLSPDSRFERSRFSPDGRMVALVEASRYLSGDEDVAPGTGATSAQGGGRITIYAFPSMRLVLRVKGDSFSECDWKSNTRLWAVAPLMAGSTPQKLVRAEVDVWAKTTRFAALELPREAENWSPESLAINGATGQVLFSSKTQIAVWGTDGKLETTFGIRPRALPKGAFIDPTNASPPRFAHDGYSLVRINGTEVERYDLSRFLPVLPQRQNQTD